MIRVVIPFHLRTLAQVDGEVKLDLAPGSTTPAPGCSAPGTPVTQRSVLDALEARYPMLRGTIRDHVTHQRRPFLRYFACEKDLSLESPDAPLPEPVVSGREPFIVLGSIAGG
jgi:sulfur-carrier protein